MPEMVERVPEAEYSDPLDVLWSQLLRTSVSSFAAVTMPTPLLTASAPSPSARTKPSTPTIASRK
jgi:hypothetical protein